MRIELRKVHYSSRLSHETAAYAAEVWIDGKKRGTVENDGHGGSDMIHPYELGKEIDAYARTLPRWEMSGESYETTAEVLLGDLLEAYLSRKDMKRALRTKVLFTLPDRKGLFEARLPYRPTEPGALVLNDMPEDQALKVYMESTKR